MSLDQYRALEVKRETLGDDRTLSAAEREKREDALLDEMDRVWWALTSSERELLDREGSRTLTHETIRRNV